MTVSDRSSFTLRAREGEPLAPDRVRETVLATARALGERQGVEVVDASADASSITVTIAAGQVVALGFAAELRRLTTSWYTSKFGIDTLWGEPPGSDDDDGWWRGS